MGPHTDAASGARKRRVDGDPAGEHTADRSSNALTAHCQVRHDRVPGGSRRFRQPLDSYGGGVREHRLPDHPRRHLDGVVQRIRDAPRLTRDLLKGLYAKQARLPVRNQTS